jgi:hypothetical protein
MTKPKIKKATMLNQEVTPPPVNVPATFYNTLWTAIALYLALRDHWVIFWVWMLACPALIHFWRWRKDKKELVARYNQKLKDAGLLP